MSRETTFTDEDGARAAMAELGRRLGLAPLPMGSTVGVGNSYSRWVRGQRNQSGGRRDLNVGILLRVLAGHRHELVLHLAGGKVHLSARTTDELRVALHEAVRHSGLSMREIHRRAGSAGCSSLSMFVAAGSEKDLRVSTLLRILTVLGARAQVRRSPETMQAARLLLRAQTAPREKVPV